MPQGLELCIGEVAGVRCSHDISSYRQVWRRSVLSRAVSTWDSVEVPLRCSDVPSWLQIERYDVDTTRQLPYKLALVYQGYSASRITIRCLGPGCVQLSARLQVCTR